MDFDNDDGRKLEVDGEDIEGMELGNPVLTFSQCHGNDRIAQARVRASEEVSTANSGAQNAGLETDSAPKKKKKRKVKSNSPAVLERRGLKLKRRRAIKKLKARADLKARLAAATGVVTDASTAPGTSASPLDETVKSRTHYHELQLSARGTFFRSELVLPVRNRLPAGCNSKFNQEEILEPVNQPWMTGQKAPLEELQVTVGPQEKHEGAVLVPQSWPSTPFATSGSWQREKFS